MTVQKLKVQPTSKRALRLTATHIPRPRLAEAIARMKRGEFIEVDDVAGFRSAIEAHKRALAGK